ncbi:MAG: extracellular solute-binding protein [bacterium]
MAFFASPLDFAAKGGHNAIYRSIMHTDVRMKSVLRIVLGTWFLVMAWMCQANVHLRMVVWDGDESLAVLRSAIKTFEKAHPGVTVALEHVDYNNYFQKLLAQYAGDTAPDVAMLDPGNFQRYAKRGALLDLNRFYGSSPDFHIDEYYKPIVDAHSLDGKLYVLPRDIAPMGLVYYNKRLFDEAKIPYPDGSWTWSWQPRPELGDKDFLTVLKKLVKHDQNGKTTQWAYACWDNNPVGNTFLYCSGSRLVKGDPSKFTQLNLDDPKVIQSYDFVSRMMNKDKLIASKSETDAASQTEAVDLFVSQRLAMFQCGIWQAPHIRKAMKKGDPNFFEWDIAMFPAFQDPETGKTTRAFPTGGSGYSILSSTRHPKESWELLQWMAGPPGMIDMAAAGIAQPAISKLARGEAWIPGPNTPADQLYPPSRIITDQAVQYVVFDPNADYWAELNSIVGNKLDNVFRGTASAEAALKDSQGVAQRRLDQVLEQRNLPRMNWPVGAGLSALLIVGLAYWVFAPDIRKRQSPRQKLEGRAGLLFASPWIVGLIVFTVGPMLLSLVMSFTDWDFITPAKWNGIANYSEALFGRDERFWNSLKVTVIFTGVSVPLGMALSLALAMLLNTKVKGIPLYRTFFYVPSLASVVASSLIFRRVFQQDGGLLNLALFGPNGTWRIPLVASLIGPDGKLPDWLGNEHLSVPALIVMSLWGVGGGMIVLLAGLKGIPEFYYDAATLDGASPWAKFRVITLPMVAPALLFSLITGLIGSFQVFTQVFVITAGSGGPNNSTRVFMLHLYDAAFNNLRMGYGAALAWILFVIVFILAMIAYRFNRNVYYEGAER